MCSSAAARGCLSSHHFACSFIFWIIQFPFCLVHPRKLRPIFLAKVLYCSHALAKHDAHFSGRSGNHSPDCGFGVSHIPFTLMYVA